MDKRLKKNMGPILSIGITSYKRVNELIRCINSIDTKYVDDLEIIVSEDCSPLSKEIGDAVAKLQSKSQYPIRFMPNKLNLGYDGNLGAIIKKASGRYIFFMSDDDALYDGALDIIIPFLKGNKDNYGVMYAPFVYTPSMKKDRYHGNSDFSILAGEGSAANFIYDSILFSGLIFRKEFVSGFDAGLFKNMNYFQVYLFLKMLYHYGGYYFAFPSVLCVGDGENAYGFSESSGGNKALQDRKSVISNLEFNKTLIKVIRLFDEEEGTHVFSSFQKQYSIHSYSGLSIARGSGIDYFKEYWKKLNLLDIKLHPITKIYYWTLLVFGSRITNSLTSGFRKLLK